PLRVRAGRLLRARAPGLSRPRGCRSRALPGDRRHAVRRRDRGAARPDRAPRMSAPPTVFAWQQSAWRIARAALARGAHALLLAGARGCGKRDLALALAASYLCDTPETDGHACGECESCHWLAAGTHPDFALVEPQEDEDEDAEAKAA